MILTATILERAETIIDVDGWTQDAYERYEDGMLVGRCAEAAINVASEEIRRELGFDTEEDRKEALELLAGVVEDRGGEMLRSNAETINHWNDEQAENVDEVKEALEEARLLVEDEEYTEDMD